MAKKSFTLEDHDVPATPCPICKAAHDRATSVTADAAAPEPGDLTVCIKCASWLRFTDDMQLVFVEDAEYRTLPEHVRIHLQEASLAVRRSWRVLAQQQAPLRRRFTR